MNAEQDTITIIYSSNRVYDNPALSSDYIYILVVIDRNTGHPPYSWEIWGKVKTIFIEAHTAFIAIMTATDLDYKVISVEFKSHD